MARILFYSKFVFILFIYSCAKPELAKEENIVSVKDFGAKGDGVTDETLPFQKAQQVAKDTKSALYIPNGIYKVDLELLHDSLQIIGEKQPEIIGESLRGGTIILGSINAKNKKHIVIRKLGVSSITDAIITGDGLGSMPLYQTYSDITLAGTGYTGYKHGFLCQSGSEIQLSNITVHRFYHGIALRCSNVRVNKVTASNCGFTSIIVKSAAGGNNLAENIYINDVNITGSSSDAYSKGGVILIQSFDDDCTTQKVKMDNITSTNGGVGVILVQQNKGRVNDISISNVNAYNTGDSPIRSVFSVEGAANNILFTNCSTSNAKGIGYYSDPLSTNVKVLSSFESNSGVAPWKGKFTFLELNNQVLVK